MACRTGCPTQDHATWGECARASSLRIGYANSAGGWDWTKEKKFRAENESYRQALRDGLDPAAPTNAAVRRAYEEAEKKG